MLPAGPNKKKIEKEARRARHSALKKDNSAKRTLHLLFSAPPPLFFFSIACLSVPDLPFFPTLYSLSSPCAFLNILAGQEQSLF